jgi:hypothetical protein
MAKYNRECANPPVFFKKVLKFHLKQPIIFLGLRAPEKKSNVTGSSGKL